MAAYLAHIMRPNFGQERAKHPLHSVRARITRAVEPAPNKSFQKANRVLLRLP